MPETEKLVIMVTHGPSEPELATLPFALAGAAVASDVEVVMGFQSDGCLLMTKGGADNVAAPGFTPLRDLVQLLREMGAQFLVCSPCLVAHQLPADQLIEGTEVVAAGRFVVEITSATNCLVY